MDLGERVELSVEGPFASGARALAHSQPHGEKITVFSR